MTHIHRGALRAVGVLALAVAAAGCGSATPTLPPVPTRAVTEPPAPTPAPTGVASSAPSDAPSTSASPSTASVSIPTRGDLIQQSGPAVAAFADGGVGTVAGALGVDVAALAMSSSGDDAARIAGIRFPGATAAELLGLAASFVGREAAASGTAGAPTTIGGVKVLAFERGGGATVHVTAFDDVVFIVEGTDAAEVERLISLIPEVVD